MEISDKCFSLIQNNLYNIKMSRTSTHPVEKGSLKESFGYCLTIYHLHKLSKLSRVCVYHSRNSQLLHYAIPKRISRVTKCILA